MHVFIQKFKICNFLSFFGEYEVELKPFSAIMCNYYQGKEDFLRALEFVFGAKLSDLKVENPIKLIHQVLQEEFLISHDIQSYVEVIVTVGQEGKLLKFRKSIKNGPTSARIEHKILDLITTKLFYEEKLNSLGLYIRQKNLIYTHKFFNNVIWGSAEDLEMTICSCLREPYRADEWKNAREEVERLTQLKRQATEKNYNSIKNSHSVIARYAVKFEAVCFNQDNFRKELVRKFTDFSSEESSPQLESPETDNTTLNIENKEKKLKIYDLEQEYSTLTYKLDSLKLKEAVLISHLYHEEIKLATKPVNVSILQSRISEVKNQIRENEKELSKIWENLTKLNINLQNISEKISYEMISLLEVQNNIFLQNRFTIYGRFNEYVQPSKYMQLLKQIVGPEIFYAHLCDTIENAFYFINLLKTVKYGYREVFISFENYSHQLKDVITASGEKGIQINTLEQLLIFICKLKHFGLIDEVPVLIQKDFDYENTVPKDFIIYIKNGIQFTTEGLITQFHDIDAFCMETEADLQKNILRLQEEEEVGYQECNDLIYYKWEMLSEISSLENDISYLRNKWKKSAQKPVAASKSPRITEIYADYAEIFNQFAEEWQKYERDSFQEEPSFVEETSQRFSLSSSDESINSITNDLAEIMNQKRTAKIELHSLAKEIRRLCSGPFYEIRLQKHFASFHNNVDKTKLFFEKEFKKLKKLMTEDDFDDFMGNQEWRKILITSLMKHFDEIKAKLKSSNERFQTVDAARKKKLFPLVEHLSHHMTSTFTHLVDNVLPMIDFNFTPGGEKLQFMSCMGDDRINIVDIKNFNTFLRFIGCLSLFLELAIFDKIPVMIFDDLEDYFPLHDEDLESVLDAETFEKIIPDNQNTRFHLLMRIGQFLEHYVKKNTPRNNIRNNGSNNSTYNVTGPMQILYFAKEDLIHAADHFIWIQNQMLPEEFISKDCDSYFEIHEVKYEDLA